MSEQRNVLRNYYKTLVDLLGKKRSKITNNMTAAQEILDKRSLLGAARRARPRVEPYVRRPLHRGGIRHVRSDVRRDGEYAEYSASAARPDGSHPPLGIYRGREGQHRDPLPAAEADEEQ